MWRKRLKRLTPLLKDPELQKKIDDAAGQTATAKSTMQENGSTDMNMERGADKGKVGGKKNVAPRIVLTAGNNTMLSQVVGIIIGSPEFQRR